MSRASSKRGRAFVPALLKDNPFLDQEDYRQKLSHLDPVTRERELRALFDALKTLDIQEGLILSETSHDPIRQDEKVVVIRSIAEWLLNKKN